MIGVIYARYSSHNQSERSIEGQIADCMKYANDHGITIQDQYIDRAMTGTNDNRESFQRMLNDSDKKAFDCVIVWKIDRFGRNREELAVNKLRLKKNGVSLFYAKENIPTGPEGIILESVLEGIAEYYSKELAQKVKRGMRTKALKCRYNGGNKPVGYDIGKDGEYILNPDSCIVKQFFEMFEDGKSYAEIARYANLSGLRTCKGKLFTGNAIRQILTNKKYSGTFTFDDIEIKDGLPRIVDDELFDSVQRKMELRDRAKSRRREDAIYMLVGKVYCRKCGSIYKADGGTGKYGTYYSYYACKGHKSGKCDAKSISKETLEDFVLNKALGIIKNDQAVSEISEAIMQMISESEQTTQLSELRKRRIKADDAINKLMQSIEKGGSEKLIDQITHRINELIEERDQLDAEIKKKGAYFSGISQEIIIKWLKSFRAEDEKTKKSIIDLLVSRVEIDEEEIIIYFNFIDCQKNNLQPCEMVESCSDSPVVELAQIRLNNGIVCTRFFFFKKFYLHSRRKFRK